MTSESDTPLEIELKFALTPELRQRLTSHPVLNAPGASGPTIMRQISTYYDTPDLTLAAAGLTLRVRASKGKRVRIQTLKSASNNTFGSRGEWEWGIRSERPDTSLLSSTPAATHGLDNLQQMVVTTIQRTTWSLKSHPDTIIEAALDEGTITAGDATCPVDELELELKRGAPAALYQLALSLHADLHLRLEPEAKAGRGFRLRSGRPPDVRKTPAPVLDRDIRAVDGFRRILGISLGPLLANLPAAVSGDHEGIHQMRIAVRRLRTALVLFKPHLERHATARFDNQLRQLARTLGEARDWDIFTLMTLPSSLKPSHRGALQPTAEDARQNALRQLRHELASPRLTGLILSLAAWAEDDALLTDPEARAARLADLAPALLDRMARKVRKRGRHIARLSGPDLHDMRKALKRLRYAVDDLGSLFPRKAVKSFGKRCAGMQDELGAINDAAVAVTLAKSLIRDNQLDHAPRQTTATAAIVHWSHKQRRKAIRKLPVDWKELRHVPPFWH